MTTATDSVVGWWPALTEDGRWWVLAVLFFVCGDVVTTQVGLATEAVAEVGPLAGPLIGSYGMLALLALKLVVLVSSISIWRYAPPAYASALPLGLAVGGGLVTMWNTVVIVQTIA